MCVFVFTVGLPSGPALEQKRGLSAGVGPRPGEAQRLSSLTFGCFQVRGKSPQVLTGPEPSQRTVSAQPLREAKWGGGNSGENYSATSLITTLRHNYGTKKVSHRGHSHRDHTSPLLPRNENAFISVCSWLFSLPARSHNNNNTALSEMDGEEAGDETGEEAPGVDSGPAPDGQPGGASDGAGSRPGVGAAPGALQLSRPGSEYYLTASDDSSSLFDEDMQRVERPRFSLHEAPCGGGPAAGDREDGACDASSKPDDLNSEELNQRFQSQRLDSSFSSSPADPLSGATPAPTPKRPNPPRDPRDTPASPKQPRLRTPAQGFGVLSVAQAKKHLSQPPVYSESTHGRTRNALSLLRPLRPQETDLDGDQEPRWEVVMETGPQEVPGSPVAPAPQSPGDTGSKEAGESLEPYSAAPGSKPPTPPLHRFPSWVGSTLFDLWRSSFIKYNL